MSRRGGASVVVVVVAGALALAGCKKSKRPSGGGAGGGGGAGSGAGGADLPALPALPSDTTAVLGFVRRAATPSGPEIRAAVQAMVGDDDMSGPEVDLFFDACVTPLTAATRRTTLVFLDRINRERIVVVADGNGLRGALEGCLGKLAAASSRPAGAARQDGRVTIYESDGKQLLALWSGDGHVVIGIERADVEHVADAGKQPLADAALTKELAAIDTGAPIWFAGGASASPPMANMASVHGAVTGTHADMLVLFDADGVAQEAAEEMTHEMGTALKVTAQGRQLHIEGEFGALLPMMGPRRKGSAPPVRAPLDDKHVRAILGAGPMMLALFLVADGGGSSKPAAMPVGATAAPAVASPAPVVVAPAAPTPPLTPTPPPPPSPPGP